MSRVRVFTLLMTFTYIYILHIMRKDGALAYSV